MRRPIALPFAALLACLLIAVGCDNSGAGGSPATGGGSASAASPLMQPFQGGWRFDLPKTLALWQAQGVPAADNAEARKTGQSFPLHPDMTIAGDSAALPGLPVTGEYAFFGLHQHNQWVCGKAWHHEDRADPGDMSKCYARLGLKDAELHLSLRTEEGLNDMNDPDLTPTPPPGSVARCTADAAPHPPWEPWMTYVFVRR